MTDFKVRGYTILRAAEYLREAGGESAYDALSAGAKKALSAAAPASWEPAEHMSEILDALVKLARGDEAKARMNLEKCGEYQAVTSTGTFLKLVMKVLTPSMFANKVPALWTRDTNAGSISVELFDDHIVMHLKDMEPLGHIAPAIVGYHRVVMKNMGIDLVKTELHGWSIDRPTSDDLWFANYWRV